MDLINLDEDFLLALELQEQLDKESWQPTADKESWQPTTDKMSIVDERWETMDPNPNIRELFLQFNEEFFWGRLSGIEVKWSPRMTLCAGLCVYEGRGGLCSVRLSLPLLKLRPRKDLVETLLHEMIHAYLFVTDNNKDHDGHGPEFHKHMYRINNATGTNISVYHNFHDEVDHFRQHWWRCNGPCQSRKPFFGYVKRAMNRAPSPRDPWWKDHQRSCDGTFIKIKEPEGYGKKKSKEKLADGGKNIQKGNPDIRTFLGSNQSSVKTNQRVIVNGVLKCIEPTGSSDNTPCNTSGHISGANSGPSISGKMSGSKTSNTAISSSEKISGAKTNSEPSSSGKILGAKTSNTAPSSSGKVLGTTKTSNIRTSVSAINTSGKISDKQFLRQKRLTELILSDSDDEDLFCSKSSQSENNQDCYSDEECLPTNLVDSPEKQNSSSVPTCKEDLDVAAKVRNVWANKQFQTTFKPLDYNQTVTLNNGEEQRKRCNSGGTSSVCKKPRTCGDVINTITNNNAPSTVAPCPVCNQSVPTVEINQHLDLCLGMS